MYNKKALLFDMEVGYQSELNWNPRQSSLAEQTTQDESHYSLLPPPLNVVQQSDENLSELFLNLFPYVSKFQIL